MNEQGGTNMNLSTSITSAMDNYNKSHNYNFTVLDALVLDHIMSSSYTNDAELAKLTICSERTIKRSINKLNSFGLIKKHIAPNHVKTLIANLDAINNFINGAQNV